MVHSANETPMNKYLSTCGIPIVRYPHTAYAWEWVCLGRPCIPYGVETTGNACGAVFRCAAIGAVGGEEKEFHLWICLLPKVDTDGGPAACRRECAHCGTYQGPGYDNSIDPFAASKPRNAHSGIASLTSFERGESMNTRSIFVDKVVSACCHLEAKARTRNRVLRHMEDQISTVRTRVEQAQHDATSCNASCRQQVTRENKNNTLALRNHNETRARGETQCARTPDVYATLAGHTIHGCKHTETHTVLAQQLTTMQINREQETRRDECLHGLTFDSSLVQLAANMAGVYHQENPKKRSQHVALTICHVVLSHSTCSISTVEMLDALGDDMQHKFFNDDKFGELQNDRKRKHLHGNNNAEESQKNARRKCYNSSKERRVDMIDKARKDLDACGLTLPRSPAIVGQQVRTMLRATCEHDLVRLLATQNNRSVCKPLFHDVHLDSASTLGESEWFTQQVMECVCFLEKDSPNYFEHDTGSTALAEHKKVSDYRSDGHEVVSQAIRGAIPFVSTPRANQHKRNSSTTDTHVGERLNIAQLTTLYSDDARQPTQVQERKQYAKAKAIIRLHEIQDNLRHSLDTHTTHNRATATTNLPEKYANSLTLALSTAGLTLCDTARVAVSLPSHQQPGTSTPHLSEPRVETSEDVPWVSYKTLYSAPSANGCLPSIPSRDPTQEDTVPRRRASEVNLSTLITSATDMLRPLVEFRSGTFQQAQHVRRSVTTPVLLVLRWISLIFPSTRVLFEKMRVKLDKHWKDSEERTSLFILLPRLRQHMLQYASENGMTVTRFHEVFRLEHIQLSDETNLTSDQNTVLPQTTLFLQRPRFRLGRTSAPSVRV
jgi:hypothetical protein